MGAVAIDIHAGERNLEGMFPMHTTEGITTFLENINHTISSMYFKGDIDALIMLVDFNTALEECKLTEEELNMLHLVYFEDIKRVDVAKQTGVTKQTVQKKLERAIKKIANYYAEMEGIKQ